jgi:predicted AlkP superfamily phosphohydrolase/phosphomutase
MCEIGSAVGDRKAALGWEMAKRRVLMIGLDAFELSLAEELMKQGEMPALRRLREKSAQFLLDHGRAKLTGLAWEHISTGQLAESVRSSSVYFERESYRVWAQKTTLPPFVADQAFRTVVFNAPYFDLDRDPKLLGVASWGAHDPGAPRRSNPPGLMEEMDNLFGVYPAEPWIYGFVWPSPEKARVMGESLAHAVDIRAEGARWLLQERLPDWDLGVVVVCESHPAVEALWHGIDRHHPLHGIASASVAGEGVRGVYRAIDRLIDKLTSAFPDAVVVLFSIHGMGSNHSDVPTMLLLSELLYRHSFGKPYLQPRAWKLGENGVPLLPEAESWDEVMWQLVPPVEQPPQSSLRGLKRWFGLSEPTSKPEIDHNGEAERESLEWMPACRYHAFWGKMRAFALPGFFVGRIRINLKGREAKGRVPLRRYNAVCDEIEALLRGCRNAITGEPVVSSIERAGGANPLELDPFGCDLNIEWKPAPLGLLHPHLGRVGPVPYRRVGGHPGHYGLAFIAGAGIEPGDYGVRSSFDVTPTVVSLLGGRIASGAQPLFPEIAAAA